MKLRDLMKLQLDGQLPIRIHAGATYPDNHKPGMQVPKGGSSCASCKYLKDDKQSCGNIYFQKWNGSDKLPAPADEYCSDWWEKK